MAKIKNTTNHPSSEWLLGGNPCAIEAQEAQGQRELLNASQLPTKSNDLQYRDAKEAYKKMGIKAYPFSAKIARVFKNQVSKIDDDPLFVPVILPAGWKIQPTDHSMWSNLIDDKGRIRANIFYKAAFYDRSAHISFVRRYDRRDEFVTKEVSDFRHRYVVKDFATGDILFETEARTDPHYGQYKSRCEQFLDERYPDWRDFTAYW